VAGKQKHKGHFIDKLAVANGFLSGITLYPQVFKVVFSGNVSGLSLVALLLLFFNSVVWCVYAIHRNLVSLLISSVLNCVASLLLFVAVTVLR